MKKRSRRRPKPRAPIRRRGQYYVYIVRARSGTYYTGYTNNLDARLKRHNSGHGAKYLKGKGPVALVYAKEYKYYLLALRAERKIKQFTRPQKEALIAEYSVGRRKRT